MSIKRSSQRGMVKLATTVALAAFAALLGVSGCSAGAASDEALGSVQQQVISCGARMPCPPDDSCGNWTCSLVTATCTVKELTPDGDKCSDPNGATGICVAHQCVAGCYEKGSEKGQVKIHPGTQPGFCGGIGDVCEDCVGTDSCTNYICGLKRVCGTVAVPDDKPCTDNSGTCYKGACCAGCIDVNGVCQPGTAVKVCGQSPPGAGHATCTNCVDTDPCTTDICAKDGSCFHGAQPDNTSCADGNTCDGAESCQGGKCAPDANFNCPTDGNVCHAPTCDAAQNCSQKLLTGNGCPDGDKCNGDEICNAGACQPGTKPDCDDKNPCTLDDCDGKLGCTHKPTEAGSNCDDGDLCNGIGSCDGGGKCVIKPSEACNDNNPCTDDICAADKGCTYPANALGCNDGDPCTTVDKCTAGTCAGSVPLKCDDGNVCTTDSCVKGQGCTAVPGNENGACNDGNNCNVGDRCVAGVCAPTSGKVCDPDTNPCTATTCAANICGNTIDPTLKCQTDKCHQFTQCGADGVCPVGTPIDCNDANPCTTDGCDALTGCTHTPDDTASCNDGDVCTTEDVCKAGTCAGKSVCMPIDDCHIAGECNAKTGACDDPRAPNDTACENGKGTCQSGKCELIPGAGGAGAGGEPATGEGGEPTTPVVAGGAAGEPTVPATAGQGTEPSETGGKAAGGKTSTNEAGAAEVPDHVFVRDPGGCSCGVPSSKPSDLAWLAGLALASALSRRRRSRAAAAGVQARAQTRPRA